MISFENLWLQIIMFYKLYMEFIINLYMLDVENFKYNTPPFMFECKSYVGKTSS